MEVFAKTHQGSRANNQDSFFTAKVTLTSSEPGIEPQEGVIIAVADGMGGLQDGDFASSETLKAIRKAVEITGFDVEGIKDAIVDVNARLFDYSNKSLNGKRVGTTCTVLLLVGGEYRLFHVGDSRCYHIKPDNSYEILTYDYTMFSKITKNDMTEELPDGTVKHTFIKRGVEKSDIYTKRDFAKLLARSKATLTRCVGAKDTVKLDVLEGTYSEGDVFLISSDGFWHGLDKDKNSKWSMYLNRTRSSDPTELLSQMIDMFIADNEKDNLTVAVAFTSKEGI